MAGCPVMSMTPKVFLRGYRRLAPLLVAVGAFYSCSLNPATGKRQFSLVSEGQEIAMGRESDVIIVAQLGLYGSEELQTYVQELGAKLSSVSERAHLPWSFKVVDDPVVNAFALPGGFLYVTRGILAHLGSEAELVGVLGHEVGHVTARHGASQMSKGILAQVGVGVTAAVSPELASVANAAQSGLGLLFLKYGRDDEIQADELGYRYSIRAGYDPSSLVEVFGVLDRVSEEAGGGDIPSWLRTHPEPERRQERIRARLAAEESSLEGLAVRREEYLRMLDGMMYGTDPRQGYFRGALYQHPQMRFRLTFPEGWQSVDQRQQLVSQSADGGAVILLSMGEGESAKAGADGFFEPAEIVRGQEWRRDIGGFKAAAAFFTADMNGNQLAGLAAFVELDGRVVRLLGFGASADFQKHRAPVEKAIASFGRLKDRRVLAVEPLRLDIFRLDRAMTPTEMTRSYKSPISAEKLALLNHVRAEEPLAKGSLVKRVIGEAPP